MTEAEVSASPSMVGVKAARDAAWALLDRSGVCSVDDIHVARIAVSAGATVTYGTTGTADARSVRAGKRSWICVDQGARGTPRGRWSAAHELGHVCLHDENADAVARIHAGVAKTGLGHQLEREADAFASELLMPEAFFARWCLLPRPTLSDIDALGDRFGTSRTATARRFAELAEAACAFAEVRGGKVARVARSAAFRGEAVQRRVVEAGSLAAAAMREEAVPEGPTRVTGGVWGSGKLGGVEMVEEVVAVPEAGVVFVWLWHAMG